jgi:hypothetical protein
MALTDIQLAQQNFLQRGGIFEMPLQRMRKAGEIAGEGDYVFKEYPKMLRLNEREVTAERIVDLCTGGKERVTETKTIWDEIIVTSEEEEERVLSGGKTTAQLEHDRQNLLFRCRNLGIHADPTWSAVRLRRELGEKMDAPEPVDTMGKLEAELATLKKMAAMQAEIAALKVQLERPADEAETMRAELTELGVKVDGRWSTQRLREELDRATAA